MEGKSIDEAAVLLKQPADYLRNEILFKGKAHTILKPCVFFPEPTSMRLAHRNANIYVKESGIEHIMKSFNAPPDDPAEAARLKRVNRQWPEDALTPFEYPQVMPKGLFELTFYPEHMDMTEAKECDRIQLYREKAVCALLTNTAVDRIMHNWYSMTNTEISRAKARIRQLVGDMVILTQGNLHYLVDVPVSIPLSDIRITDKMLTQYAASKGIPLPEKQTETTLPVDQATGPVMKTFTQEEVAVILKTDIDSVFKRMMGRLGVLLQPSIIIKTPVLMHRNEFVGGNPDDYGRDAEQIVVKEELKDIFGVDGIRPLQWDELGLAQITFGEWPPDREEGRQGNSSGVLLSQGEHSYMVIDPLKIRREDLVVTDVDLLQYGKETIGVTFELPQEKLKAYRPKRHRITEEERKTKGKSAIQLAVEAYLDNTPAGNKAGFYTFLKKQIKLPKEVILKDGESYACLFKDVKEKGSQEGVYLNHPKEGKKEGDPAWNHYPGNDVSGIISKEKKNRKISQPEK